MLFTHQYARYKGVHILCLLVCTVCAVHTGLTEALSTNEVENNDSATRRLASVHSPAAYSSCLEYARSIKEPFSDAYKPRNNLDELNAETPLAYWSWDGGNVDRATFDKLAADPRFVHYKIVDRRVYVDASWNNPRFQPTRKSTVEDVMKLAVHLYPIPDMEYLAFYGDETRPGRPVLAMCALKPRTGFTLPTKVPWLMALGPTQMAAYHGCLRDRYPAADRKPLIVWRGSATGKNLWPPTEENCKKLVRVRVHLLAREHPDLFDTRIRRLVQDCTETLRPLITDLGSSMLPEDFNRYCAVMDMDGNSWSDRFEGTLLHYPTPVLKQVTNITSCVDHFFRNGTEIELFDGSLDGIVAQARRMIEDCKLGEKSEGQAMVRRMQAAASELLSHVGIVRSMAYALVNYKRFMAFEPNTSLEGFKRLSPTCCGGISLPAELLEAMAAAERAG